MSQNLNTDSLNNPTVKGLNTDFAPHLQNKEIWTYARNAVLNSHNGNIYALQNEQSNSFCVQLPYTFIGSIPLIDNRFAIFTTDNTNSEIGLFDANACTYTTIVNDPCLAFNTSYLISGKSKYNFDCTETVYWADSGLNSRRYIVMDSTKVPRVVTGYDGCDPIYGTALDCNKILIDPNIQVPTLNAELSNNGTLKNGTYQFAVAYSIKKERITDIYSFTNPISVFAHNNTPVQGIHLKIDRLDGETFDEYELFVAYTIDNYTTYKSLGFYTIGESEIDIYSIDRPEYTAITSSDIFVKKIIYEKAQWCEGNDKYLLWGNLTQQVEVDYQLTAMDIASNYFIVEAPYNYYKRGGENVGYYGDEVYAFGIQWLRSNGSYTDVYHIPGTTANSGLTYANYPSAYMDVYESGATCAYEDIPPVYYVFNSAQRGGQLGYNISGECDLTVRASGVMAYWQSTSEYPNNADTFGSQKCTPIRHHKFPNEAKEPRFNGNPYDAIRNPTGLLGVQGNIRIKGIKFSNIEHPKDADGNYLTDIVGFRIVRSDRTGNRTIVARGYSTNMRYYFEREDPTDITSNIANTIMYPNYPCNDLGADPFLGNMFTSDASLASGYSLLNTSYSDRFTFYSPHTLIGKYALGTEVIFEADDYCSGVTTYKNVYQHPEFKLWTAAGVLAAETIGSFQVMLDLAALYFQSPAWGATGIAVSLISALPAVFFKAMRTSQDVIDIIDNAWPWQNYAVQGDSFFGFLWSSPRPINYGHRRGLDNYTYLGDGLNIVPRASNVFINNFKKPAGIYLDISSSISPPLNNSLYDNSRQLLPSADPLGKRYINRASVYYTTIKRRIDNQYGPLDSVKYVNTGYEQVVPTLPVGANPDTDPVFYSTEVVFGGDCFINQFSVNQPQPFFTSYPLNTPNGTVWDYRNYRNLAYPAYWLNSAPFTVMDGIYGGVASITNLVAWLGGSGNVWNASFIPESRHRLDDFSLFSASALNFIVPDRSNLGVGDRNNVMYTSYNGTAITYVESDFNLEFRDYKSNVANVFTINSSLDWIYRSDNLFTPEEFVYDFSYSKQNTELYAVQQALDFSLSLSLYCNPFNPNAVIYSLPAQQIKQDHWLYYLPNNIYTFPINDFGNLVSFHSIDNQQIIFFFDKAGPYVSIGRDQLETKNGITVTIGDAALFAREPRPIEYTDYGFGSSTSRFVFKPTAYGNYYASRGQGKVFAQAGMKLKDISNNGNKYWFSQYLPSYLLSQFPNYPHIDNAVKGVGLISTYDPTYETFILTERDYKCLNPDITYNETLDKFYLGETEVSLTNPIYFEDASWTMSYKADLGVFVSWHDYHPIGYLQGAIHFMSVHGDANTASTIWKHNEVYDSYANYYGIDHPFAVQLPVNNQVNIETIRSLEFFAETYVYSNKLDYFHVLDTTFDYAMITNSEQVSGWLHLNPIIRNQVSQQFLYPYYNNTLDQYEIKIDKVENRYRINQFWDITKDRGEYSGLQIPLILTESNGYKFEINPIGVDYAKPQTQRKKFRHKTSKIYLEREVSGNNKITLHFSDTKQTHSPR
jgi:hypothetical protein